MNTETNTIIVTLAKPLTTVSAVSGGVVASIASYLGYVNVFIGFLAAMFGLVAGGISLYLKWKALKKYRASRNKN